MTTTTTTTNTYPTKKTKTPHILLGITGSVASIKGPEIALSLSQSLQANVIVILTNGGMNFWYKAKEYNNGLKWDEYYNFMFEQKQRRLKRRRCDGGKNSFHDDDDGDNKNNNINGNGRLFMEQSVFTMLESYQNDDNCNDSQGDIAICLAQDEWNQWNKIGDPVLHIQLRDWADLLIIAPLSAHTLAKISNGLCDDTLSCIIRAWNYGSGSSDNKRKPIIVAPAMNTAMWEHPLTQKQLDTMKGFWSSMPNDSNDNESSSMMENGCQTFVVNPQVKLLACGDLGTGAMADIDDIVNMARQCLS